MALVIEAEKCTCCGTCGFTCPEGAIARNGEAFVIDLSLCTECRECQLACPVDCIRHPDEL